MLESDIAVQNAVAIEGAKVSSILLLACTGAIGSPLLAPAAGMAAIGYASAVAVDWFLTGRLCLLPLSRKTPVDVLVLAGAFQSGQIDERAIAEEKDWRIAYASRPGLDVAQPILPTHHAPTVDVPVLPLAQIAVPQLSDVAIAVPAKLPAPPPSPWDDPVDDVEEDDDDDEEFDADIELHPGLSAVVTKQCCTAIFGRAGSGKGMQLANAVRELKKKSPETYVFAIDPKADPKESGYWDTDVFDEVRRLDINKLDANNAATWLFEQIEDFHRLSLRYDRPYLLIWDEVMTSTLTFQSALGERAIDEKGRITQEWIYKPGRQMLNEIQRWAGSWISSGDSRGIRAWFVTQSGNLNDLPFPGGVKTQLRYVVLARPVDGPIVQKMVETKTIAPGQGNLEKIAELCDRSPVGRAIYLSDDGQWHPLAKLHNYSGFDRDAVSNSQLPHPKP